MSDIVFDRTNKDGSISTTFMSVFNSELRDKLLNDTTGKVRAELIRKAEQQMNREERNTLIASAVELWGVTSCSKKSMQKYANLIKTT